MNRSYIKTSRTPEIIFASAFLSICLHKCIKATVLIRRKKGVALCFLMIPCLVLLQIGCGGGGSSGGNGDTETNSNPRSFHLGFTPFPYDISQEAVDFSYDTIANDADIIAHHFDDGVPWPEALAGTPYDANILDDWELRKNETPVDHKVYVAITPINLNRDGLALYWGAEDNMDLPGDWAGYAFNHPNVITAFLNHAVNTIDYFEPDFLAIGIEVNLLLNNSPAKWDAYVEMHREVYAELKQRYPDLPIMASVFGLSLLDGYRSEDDHTAQMAAFQEIINYSDYYAISLYPYMSIYLTDSIPDTMYTDLFSLSNKPIAIAETGYPAQSFSIGVGTANQIDFNSSPEKQNNYITGLLEEAESRDFVFIVNFVLRDYDALWEKIGRTDLAAVWRDTGLYDENGFSRPALRAWQTALTREHDGNDSDN